MTGNAWNGWSLVLSAGMLVLGAAAGSESDKKTKKQVAVPEAAVAVLAPTRGNDDVQGVLMLTQEKKGVRIRGRIRGLEPGQHGFHIHEFGDLRSRDGSSAGGHFNPHDKPHGGPDDADRHAGDLGNVDADAQGVAEVDKLAEGLKLHFVLGRSLVVHAGTDDFTSQPSGDAGARLAIGVIGFAQPGELGLAGDGS